MAELQVVVNPYYRSVSINGEEVIHRIIPYPDYFNSLASITCDYDEKSKKITEVANVHRYVSHYVEKQYYYKHLSEYIDWYYAEKEAQETAAEAELAKWKAIQDAIDNANDTIAEYVEKITLIKEKVETLVASISDLKSDGSDIEVTATDTETSRTLGDRFADTINVKDYGAVGDGETDDSEAFEAAIAVAKEKNAILYIPVGNYLIDTKPDIPAYGSGNIIINNEDEDDRVSYKAFDLLTEFLNLKQEIWGICLDDLPEDTTELLSNLPIGALVNILNENGVSDEIANTIIKKIGGTYNTREIITESGEWTVPVTGYYKVTCISGGDGSFVYTHTNAGYAGSARNSTKLLYLVKDTVINISIGAGGIGGSGTAFTSTTYGGNTLFGNLFSSNSTTNGAIRTLFPANIQQSRYFTNEGVLQALAPNASYVNAYTEPNGYRPAFDGMFPGGPASCSYTIPQNISDKKVNYGNGASGAVIIYYYDPSKDNDNTEIPEGSNVYNALLERIQALESKVDNGLLYNDEILITESGDFEVPEDGWYEVTCIDGGNGGLATSNNGFLHGGFSGKTITTFKYLTKNSNISVTIGAGGTTNNGAGGITNFGDISTALSSLNNSLNGTFAHAFDTSKVYGAYGGGKGGGKHYNWVASEPTYYGAGGSAAYISSSYTATTGYQGCVKLRFYNPNKSTITNPSEEEE